MSNFPSSKGFLAPRWNKEFYGFLGVKGVVYKHFSTNGTMRPMQGGSPMKSTVDKGFHCPRDFARN